MILGFKTKFPDGSPTNFIEAIESGEKIHSIREGLRWGTDMNIHMATGVRTKNYRQFALKRVVSVQRIIIRGGLKEVWVSGRKLSSDEIERLAKNDGLTVARFWEWFHSNIVGQIIHWTDYRY